MPNTKNEQKGLFQLSIHRAKNIYFFVYVNPNQHTILMGLIICLMRIVENADNRAFNLLSHNEFYPPLMAECPSSLK